jgi:hypothetical protein
MAKDSSAIQTVASPSEASPAIDVALGMIRAAIDAVPADQRDELKRRLTEDLTKPQIPVRGGEVLNNIVRLFQNNEKTDWTAAEIRAALSTANGNEPPKAAVYSALQYLGGMKILRRVGYGRYVVDGGGLLITHDRGGD